MAKNCAFHLYLKEKEVFDRNDGWRYERLPEERLYGYSYKNNRIYKTNITRDDLLEWYIPVSVWYTEGYVSAKDIVKITYKPIKMLENHLFKDDYIEVEYSDGAVHKFWDFDLIHMLNAAKEFSNYDIESIKDEIWHKCLSLKDVPSFDYLHYNGNVPEGKPETYFDEINLSREEFESWWDA